MEFAGKTVLFTGAAGGLGAESALAYMRAGARVICVDIDEAKIAALEARAQAVERGSLAVERLDLGDLAGLERGLAALVEREGHIDIVINNAAIYPAKPFEEFTLADYQEVQRVNVEAGVVCVRAALPGMRAARLGADRQHRQRHLLRRLGQSQPLCRLQGGAGRADPRLGARVRRLRHHGQRHRPRRLPDRRREDPPRPRRLHALRARPPGASSAAAGRTTSPRRSCS